MKSDLWHSFRSCRSRAAIASARGVYATTSLFLAFKSRSFCQARARFFSSSALSQFAVLLLLDLGRVLESLIIVWGSVHIISIRNYLVTVYCQFDFVSIVKGMSEIDADSAELAELLVHVGRVLRSDSSASPLTAAQWTCLRFFSRAGKEANTSSAFADFHGTSRGTASQIIKSLHDKGLLTKIRSKQDARSHIFKLSTLGLKMLDQDPLQSLVSAVDYLGPKNREQLQKLCYSLLENVRQIRNKRPFGTCSHCTYYATHSGSPERSHCKFDQKDLAPEMVGNWCCDFSLS